MLLYVWVVIRGMPDGNENKIGHGEVVSVSLLIIYVNWECPIVPDYVSLTVCHKERRPDGCWSEDATAANSEGLGCVMPD